MAGETLIFDRHCHKIVITDWSPTVPRSRPSGGDSPPTSCASTEEVYPYPEEEEPCSP